MHTPERTPTSLPFSRARAALIVAAALLPAGCAHYQNKTLSPAQTAADLQARSLSDTNLKAFLEHNLRTNFPAWPLTNWDFPHLTLAALYFHPSLDVARAQWNVAQAGETTAGARPNPTISAGPQYNINAARGITPWLAFIDFEVPIETAGKRGYRVAQAKHLSESARLNIATTAWQVRSRLRAALLDFAAADQRAALLEQQVRVQEQIVQRLEQKHAAGAAAGSEALPHRIALQKARLDLSDAERLRAEARPRIAQAVGVPAEALAPIALPKFLPDDATLAPPLSAAEARRVALFGRPDLGAALLTYEASQAALQVEIAKQYPNLKLGPGWEYDQGENKFGLLLGAEVPLFNRNQGPIAEASARREEAAARFLDLQARVIGDLDRALESIRSAQRRRESVAALIAAQRQQQQSVQDQLAAGAAEQLDLLAVQAELAATSIAGADAALRVRLAIADLEDALQQPFDGLSAVDRQPRPVHQAARP